MLYFTPHTTQIHSVMHESDCYVNATPRTGNHAWSATGPNTTTWNPLLTAELPPEGKTSPGLGHMLHIFGSNQD